MRSFRIDRKTGETDVHGAMCIEGKEYTAEHTICTGIGFLDHMLTLFEKHGGFALDMRAFGDLEVDNHHTVEDIGIVLGKLIAGCAGDKEGIKRYGYAKIPMDEVLTDVTLDMSGRPFIVFNCDIPSERTGDFECAMTEEFFRGVAFNSGMTLHINVLYGKNAHHIIESIFKAFARALKEALTKDDDIVGVMSTKGVL